MNLDLFTRKQTRERKSMFGLDFTVRDQEERSASLPLTFVCLLHIRLMTRLTFRESSLKTQTCLENWLSGRSENLQNKTWVLFSSDINYCVFPNNDRFTNNYITCIHLKYKKHKSICGLSVAAAAVRLTGGVTWALPPAGRSCRRSQTTSPAHTQTAAVVRFTLSTNTLTFWGKKLICFLAKK